MEDQAVKLGETYRDSITGFEGVATGRHEYLYGCVRISLEGASSSGEPKLENFDEQRLTSAASATSGGPQQVPAPR